MESFERLSKKNRKKIQSLPILPIHSNPLFIDSDGDEIYDKYDEESLWHDFIMNEMGGNSVSSNLERKAKNSYFYPLRKRNFLPVMYSGKETDYYNLELKELDIVNFPESEEVYENAEIMKKYIPKDCKVSFMK